MTLNLTMIWLLIGAGLCLVELIVPTAFIAFVMGLSALIVATVSHLVPLGVQVLLWIILSLLMVMISRRLVSRTAKHKFDAIEAETLTEIRPGEAGRVLYEGNSWAARSEAQTDIPAGVRVYVVGRKGTTLMVMPEEF